MCDPSQDGWAWRTAAFTIRLPRRTPCQRPREPEERPRTDEHPSGTRVARPEQKEDSSKAVRRAAHTCLEKEPEQKTQILFDLSVVNDSLCIREKTTEQTRIAAQQAWGRGGGQKGGGRKPWGSWGWGEGSLRSLGRRGRVFHKKEKQGLGYRCLLHRLPSATMRRPAHAGHHAHYSLERGSWLSPQMSSQIQNLLYVFSKIRVLHPMQSACLLRAGCS